MTQTLLKVIADLEISLAAAVSVGQTTATLTTAVDADGVALPSGKYGFTIDGGNSAKEFIVCDLVSTALTNVQSVTKQGAISSGFVNYHRVGATVTITDWIQLGRITDNLDGTTGFNAATPLNYDAEPDYSDPLTIPTVQFVLDTASGGIVTFNRQIFSGNAGETIIAGDWVYLNTTDGEWYKTDADDTAKSLNVQIGKAIGAGTDGNPITGGIFISGTETVGTYVAGTTYYLGNTAGELATSAGTNSVVVGTGDANGDLVLRKATPNQVDAQQGGSTFGSPSSINKFITQDYNASATGLPVVRTYTANTPKGDATTQFDVTNPTGTTFRYTWDSTGTDPTINSGTMPIGTVVDIQGQNFTAANKGLFVTTGVGTDYFEVTNASGVAEINKTLGTGYLILGAIWTKPTGLKYITLEVQGAGTDGWAVSGSDLEGYGGASGGYSRKLFAVSELSATENLVAGAKASAVASYVAGRSVFKSVISTGATVGATLTTVGVAGTATGGDLNINGQLGVGGDSNAYQFAGSGGDSFLGLGGFAGAVSGDVNGKPATGYGAGGGGAVTSGSGSGTSGVGTSGIIILTEHYS